MRTRSANPARSSPYPKRDRTRSSRAAESAPLAPTSQAPNSNPGPNPHLNPKHPSHKRRRTRPHTQPTPTPTLRSPLFTGVNPVYLVRAMRSIAKGNYPDAHGFLHLCVVQARNAAPRRVSSLVVCLLMLYADNWVRLGFPNRAMVYIEDAVRVQELIGDESDEDRMMAAEAGRELRELMQPKDDRAETGAASG